MVRDLCCVFIIIIIIIIIIITYGMSSVAILYVEIYVLYIEIFMGLNIYLWTKKIFMC